MIAKSENLVKGESSVVLGFDFDGTVRKWIPSVLY